MASLPLSTPELEAYWATPQFADYLDAKAKWEDAKERYCKAPAYTQEQRLALSILFANERAMNTALAICRNLPVHKEAFGW